jgi:4-diphosphocytidyl-2-C-methyl-D-erythritol kinase
MDIAMKSAYQRTGLSCNPGPRSVEIAAPAKINLFLEILRKRRDGYHELETVMTSVSLFDQLRLSAREDGQIRLKLMNSRFQLGNVPTDDRNLAVKAVHILRKFIGDNRLPGCDILLYKRIPSEAGLGGASSDAAAALLAGKLLWNLNLTESELLSIAADLGSDVPYFLFGGTAMCRGRGERIEPLPTTGGIPVVIAKPVSGLSTGDVFSNIQVPQQRRAALPLLSEIVGRRFEKIGNHLFNRLTEAALPLNPEIAEIVSQFEQTSAIGHQMSGSGSSYFGIFRSMRAARQAAQLLSNRLPKTSIYITQTLGSQKPTIPVMQPN